MNRLKANIQQGKGFYATLKHATMDAQSLCKRYNKGFLYVSRIKEGEKEGFYLIHDDFLSGSIAVYSNK